MARVQASYSGKWPSRCYGEWRLMIDGVDVSNKIPDHLRKNHHMNTEGTYQRQYLGRRGTKVDTYTDGLEFPEWADENKDWLSTITKDQDVWEDIYDAISNEDWRHGCCGGCI